MRARAPGSSPTVAGARPESGRPAVAAAKPLVQRAIVVQRDVKDDRDFAAAARDPNRRREAVVYLGTHPEAAKNAKLDLATVEAMLPLVGGPEHAARGALLERGFAITTKENPNWEKAVGFVLALDDPGIVRNLGSLSDKEAKLLAKGARFAGRAGDDRLIDPLRKKIRREAPGQLFGDVTVTMVPHHGVYHKYRGNEMFWCTTTIEFKPDPDVCEATSIAFIQTVSMLDDDNDTVDNRTGLPERFNSKKQAVDRPAGQKYGFYGQANDGSFPKPTTVAAETTPGISVGGSVVPARLVDRPDGTERNVTYSYETSIVAKDGPDTGFVYAVVLWGFRVDKDMQVVPKEKKIQQIPTADFGAAVAAWNKQATSKQGVARGQQPLPAQRLAVTAGHPVPARSTRDLRTLDPASRARLAATLQRSVGNQAARQLIAPVQRCGGEVHAGRACAEDTVQRQEKGSFGAAPEAFLAEHKALFDSIQAHWMRFLLPEVAALPPEVRADETAAQSSGGPRLVAAVRAVAAKGKPWQSYFETNNAVVSGLPPDQIGDIVQFLGGPKDAAYYPADQIKGKEFGGKFDGSVDPVAGLVTLYFRVRFDTDGVRWGPSPAGTPKAEQEARDGRTKFQADFKRVVESSWSFKGKIKAACPVGGKPALDTKVVVTVVDSGEHTVFHLHSESAQGRANAEPGEGNLKIDSVQEGKPVTKNVSDPTGKHPTQVTTTQTPAAHEFGHAIGLHHPHCKGGEDNCYGVTAEERQDIMGAGNMLQVIKRGKAAPHDDFGPFEAIAKTWGETHLVGASAACNVWTAAP